MSATSIEVPAAVRSIQSSLARAAQDIPALVPLLDAFGPLFVERARLRLELPGWQGQPPAVDAERFSQGAFVLADSGFEDMSALLPLAVKALLPVLAQSFPALAAEFAVLDRAIESGALAPGQLAAAGFGEPVEAPGVSTQAMSFASSELVRPFIERQAQDLAGLVKDLPWRQAFCPVCGNAPNMSVLRPVRDDSEFIQAHGGRRYLRCSCCATEWTHKRVSCPACGCEEPDDLVVLRDPARPHERADACKRCKTFVLCLDSGELAEAPDPDVAALTMLPLEVQAKKQGFAPLAGHPWSGL